MENDFKKKLNGLSPHQIRTLIRNLGKEKKELPKMARNTENKYPLTSAEKRMWFLSKLDSDSFMYTNPMAIRLKTTSPIELDQYIKSFKFITDRHEIMRTSFASKDGEIFRIIHEHILVDIKMIDLRHYDESCQMEMVEIILCKDGQTPIDIESFPLFRHSILQLSELEYIFIYTSHHIISDAWSSSLLFRNVLQVYDDIKNGKSINLPPIEYQYIDYVNWENNWLQSTDYTKTLEIWRSLLPYDPEPLNLPFDYIRPLVINYEGALEKTKLGAQLVTSLVNFSKHENVNLFHTLLSVFNILLHRYSGNEDIVVGIPLANRNVKEFQGTLGLFLNTLPHKTTIDGKLTFRDYLNQVKNVSQSILLNQALPFEKLIEETCPKRNVAISPFFQVLFVYQNIPSLYEWGGMKLSPEKADFKISKFPLNLWLEDVGDELLLSMTYQTSLFKQSTIKRFFRHFEFLLNEVVNNPGMMISDLKMEAQKSTEHLIETFSENTYIREFEKQVVISKDKLALQYLDICFTYDQLNKKANQVANYLVHTKESSDKVIAILLGRSNELISSLFGIIKSGCAYLPIDPSIPQKRLEHILHDAKINYIITESKFKSRFGKSKKKLLLVDEQGETIQSYSTENLEITINPNDLVYVMYTSGSTGVPKGVCIEHRQLLNYCNAIWKRMKVDHTCKFATVSSIATDLGNTQIFPALIKGASVNIISDDLITNAQLLANYISKNQIDCLKIVPSLLSSLLSVINSRELLPRKLLILGGEKISPGLVENIRSKDKHIRIINHYGPTETTIGVLTHEISEVKINSIIPLGKALDNNIVFIADKKNIELPEGIMGEIVVCGNNVGRGYNNNQQLTNPVFVKGIGSAGVRCYKTGDSGRRLEDGNIEYLGRLDRQKKIRGYRVELEEIERTILQNEKITQVVVISQTENSLTAFIRVVPNEEINTTELIRELRLMLPDYMVPDYIVILDSFPRLGNGKIDLNKLKELKITHSKKQSEGIVAPRDEVELRISHIWKEVLKTNTININDIFFDIGGNSLKAIELIGKVNNCFSISLSIGIIFECSTINLLARMIRNQTHSSVNNHLVELRQGRSDTKIFFVHPAGGNILCYYELAQQLADDYPVYGLQSFISDKSDFSIKELAKRYLEVIKKQIPMGIYVFIGWSMGALIAYEMAVQLQETEKSTSEVIILDQQAPVLTFDQHETPKTHIERLAIFAEKVEHLIGLKINISKIELQNLSPLEQSELFLSEFKDKNMLTEDTSLENFHGFLEKMIFHNEITMDYRAEKYSGNVLLIKANDSNFKTKHFENEESYGWTSYIKNFEILTVPGNHITIMTLPNVKNVAREINKKLAFKHLTQISQKV